MAISASAREELFINPRTVSHFTDQEVTDEVLREIYELTKMGPTAFNSQPLRITWVRSAEARQRLAAHMVDSNQAKTIAAPMTAILGFDRSWFQRFGEFNPRSAPNMQPMFEGNPEAAEGAGALSAHLQAGYFITAVRALGLDAGPMTGGDLAAITTEFLADKNQQAFLIVNLGYGIEPSYPRNSRFEFEDVTETI